LQVEFGHQQHFTQVKTRVRLTLRFMKSKIPPQFHCSIFGFWEAGRET
jgi:hypothetical protein